MRSCSEPQNPQNHKVINSIGGASDGLPKDDSFFFFLILNEELFRTPESSKSQGNHGKYYPPLFKMIFLFPKMGYVIVPWRVDLVKKSLSFFLHPKQLFWKQYVLVVIGGVPNLKISSIFTS